MKLKCVLGFHEWIGCRCANCGKTRAKRDEVEDEAEEEEETSLASGTLIFVYRHSPNNTLPKSTYLKAVLSSTCGLIPDAKVVLKDCGSSPDSTQVLLEVTAAAELGDYGMQPLDQYDVRHWRFSDRDGGTGCVVRANYRPNAQVAQKRADEMEALRADVLDAIASASGGVRKKEGDAELLEVPAVAVPKGAIQGQQVAVDLGHGVTLELVRIPAGTFMMGSDTGRSDEKPVHRVAFAKPFYMGKFQVTQEQWQAVTGSDPSCFSGPSNPVERVSLGACQGFLKKLNDKTGRMFALPSEAEWEYSCRAGSTTEYCFGDAESGLGEYAWCELNYELNSGKPTHPVGQKKPNAWGLYDMHGNVWEWCEDLYHSSYRGAPADGSAWLQGGDQTVRVLRGGAWSTDASFCRSAYRFRFVPSNDGRNYGCRVVLRDF